MADAFIVDIVRSPFGKGREGGALASLHPIDLFAQVLQGLIRRTDIDPVLVEDLIAGCVIQFGEQSSNVARQAWLAAGYPATTPGVTLDRKCGSAQQAMDFAAQGVMAGAYDLVIAGGVEMMGRVPMGSNRQGHDYRGPMFDRRFPDGMVHQGVSAELIAARWNLSREDMDRYALRSHQRAALAEQREDLARQIIAVEVPTETGATRGVDRDEGIRHDTSLEKLASLKPAFQNEAMAARFPQIRWSVTAGNSSQVTDGATAMLIASEQMVKRFNLKPRAMVRYFAVVGDDPIMMLSGVIPATRKVLDRAGLKMGDIGAFEVNEAFASVVLAWARELDADMDNVNVNGGAIALGHPVGASGGRLTCALLDALEQGNGKYGLQTMCESGGMANATIIERLE